MLLMPASFNWAITAGVNAAVPAGVARGQYKVEVYLFRDGEVQRAQSTPLFIDQTGLERRLYNFAHNQPFGYGLAAVAMAVIMGWISSLLFRRPT
mgnify:CR=1 FL=1